MMKAKEKKLQHLFFSNRGYIDVMMTNKLTPGAKVNSPEKKESLALYLDKPWMPNTTGCYRELVNNLLGKTKPFKFLVILSFI
jgi:hypothetical protein